MLIPTKRLVDEFGVRPSGVLHVGAHLAEEAADYDRHRFGHVWWVEANPSLIDPLKRVVGRTARMRANHSVIQALIGEHEGGSATLRITNNGMSSSVLPFGTHATEHPEVTMTGEEVTLPIRTIDMLAIENDIRADFLNVDVQGYELAALRGAVRFLADVRWVFAEVNEAEVYVGCPLVGEIDEYLAAHGFERVLTHMTPHGWGDALYSRSPHTMGG